MSFLNTMKSFFTGGSPAATDYWVYARCQRCGEVIKTRIDLQNSLSAQDEGGYVTHKTLVGNRRCFQRIEVILYFDEQRRPTGADVINGDLVSAEEYAAAKK